MPTFTLFTLFPEMFPGTLGQSLAGQALQKGLWNLQVIDIKEYGIGKHRQVDDTPYGGGAGMVMRPDVLGAALDAWISGLKTPPLLLYMSPRGKKFDQNDALSFTSHSNIGIVCARFEGIDERIIAEYGLQEVSIGDVILSGGELPAQVIMDACIRLIPGVLGAEATLEEESFSGELTHLLEYPHYTRPPLWKGRAVPEILCSGNHEKIAAWRMDQAKTLTRERRTDLWEQYETLRMYGHNDKKD
jgi:tRNA (guanine37-N1)-methyltransferase